MKRLIFSLLVSCLLCESVEAHLDRSPSVARSLAAGSAFVSVADGASAIFVNPAGVVLVAPLACYLEYAEPAGIREARESRLALAAGSGKTHCGLGWYRLVAEDESDNLLIVGVARRLIEGTQGSFLAIGASAALGSMSVEQSIGGRQDTWSKMTGDAGIIVKPLSVISLAYSIGNLRDAHPDGSAGDASWRRVQRWGASYFWEDRLILSFAEEHRAGRTTIHYGLSMKTAAPVELMAGFSDAHVTGGAHWTGRRCAATVAFASGDAGQVTWTGAFEIRMGRGTNGERP
jgi:hypothetical protein